VREYFFISAMMDGMLTMSPGMHDQYKINHGRYSLE
jgi:hypothetical protein